MGGRRSEVECARHNSTASIWERPRASIYAPPFQLNSMAYQKGVRGPHSRSAPAQSMTPCHLSQSLISPRNKRSRWVEPVKRGARRNIHRPEYRQ